MTSTAARRPAPSGSAWTARNTRSTSAPRTATSSARRWSSTSRTAGGPAARPGALPAAGAAAPPSIPPRSASGPRGRASRSRTAAGSRPASSSSTRRPQEHKPPSGAPGIAVGLREATGWNAVSRGGGEARSQCGLVDGERGEEGRGGVGFAPVEQGEQQCREVMVRAFSAAALARACWITVLPPAVISGTCLPSAARPVGWNSPRVQSDRGKRGAIELVGGVVGGRGVDAHKPGEFIVLQEGEQQVIGSDSPVASALRFISRVFDRGPGAHGRIVQTLLSRFPYFACTDWRVTPRASPICSHDHPARRASATCTASTRSARRWSAPTARRPIAGSAARNCSRSNDVMHVSLA